MLKTSYDSQESIPENLRGAYVLSDDKWVLDALSADHPVVAKRDELLTENRSQKATITRVTNEKQALEASSLPAGHVATPSADAQYVELKSLGTPEEIKTKLSAHDDLKQKVESQEKQTKLREIAIEEGYDPDKIASLEDRFPAPFFKEVEVDGKKQQRAIFKVQVDGKEVERSFTEHLEGDSKLKPLQDSLKATSNGTKVHRTSSNNGGGAKNVFEKVREQVKAEEAQRVTDVHPMFQKIPGRVNASQGE